MTTTPHAHTHSHTFTPLLNTWLPRRRQSIFATAATLYSSKTTTVVVVVLWLSPPFHSLSFCLSLTHSIPLFFIVTISLIYLTNSHSLSWTIPMCATRSCRFGTLVKTSSPIYLYCLSLHLQVYIYNMGSSYI
jgi:hypothetical protein